MDRKKLLIPILIGVLIAALLGAVLLMPGESVPPAETVGTIPHVQTQTGPTLPVQTTVPEETETVPTVPAEPEETRPEQTEPEYTEPEETDPPVYEPELFPMELEGGRLTVQSIFQFTGMNPDADDLFGEDIAGVQMTNTSGEHMTYAEVTAVLTDGTTLTFRAEDVPPGRTVMAFCLEHESLADVRSREEVFGYAEFESGDQLLTDLVELTVTGTEITVKNVSGEDLTDLEVICHGLLDGGLFGGTTYHYNVSTLPAGASTVVHAVDCILGMAEVVRVDRGG